MGGGLGDVLEVHRVALDQASEADDRVVHAALGQPQRRGGNLERAGHAHDGQVLVADGRLGQRARAPFSNPSVISSLKRETTIAKR